MKKISLIIILLIMPISHAAAELAKDTMYLNEYSKLVKEYSTNYTDDEYKNALQLCAGNGNYLCAMGLGEIHLEEKNYKAAANNLKLCSEKCEGWCDFQLGHIYHDGLGILQNDDKALSHFKKGANLGHSPSAYLVSMIYFKKASNIYNGKYSEENAKRMSNYGTLGYAWLKVAKALDQENYLSEIDEKMNLSTAKLFDEIKNGIESEGLLQKADNMATQICSKNKFCKQ